MDEQTHTVTTDQLLQVFLAGSIAGAQTAIYKYLPQLALAAPGLALDVSTSLERQVARDPAMRHEALTTVEAALAIDPKRWAR